MDWAPSCVTGCAQSSLNCLPAAIVKKLSDMSVLISKLRTAMRLR